MTSIEINGEEVQITKWSALEQLSLETQLPESFEETIDLNSDMSEFEIQWLDHCASYGSSLSRETVERLNVEDWAYLAASVLLHQADRELLSKEEVFRKYSSKGVSFSEEGSLSVM